MPLGIACEVLLSMEAGEPKENIAKWRAMLLIPSFKQ